MKFTHLKIKNSYYLMTHLKDKVTKHLKKKNKNKYLKKDYILSNSKKNDQN